MTDIRVPNLGESVTEATVARWLKSEGDQVAADEPLVELETDKVSVEVPAPAAGTLSEIAAKGGETVGVGALLGQISAGAAAGATKRNGDATPAPAASTKGHGAEEALRQGEAANAPSRAGPSGAQNDVGTSGAGQPGASSSESTRGGQAGGSAGAGGASSAAADGAEIRVPALGESVTEATVAKILKKQGESVAADEAVVELETDKVSVEVPSPVAGTIRSLAVKEGDTVAVGALIGSVGGSGASAAPAKAAPAAGTSGASPASAPAKREANGNGGMPPAPSARKAMEEAGLSASDVEGSGRRGQILKGDVIAAIERGATAAPAGTATAAPASAVAPVPNQARRAPSPAAEAEREERVPMTRLRRTIARRLKDAQNTAAMLTTFNDVDMSAVMELRTAYKDTFEKKHKVKLGFMAFFSKACVQALKEIPAVNAEIDGDDLVYKNYYHIGVAVGTDKGLVVPVVRDADQKSFAEIEKTINDFGRRARDGQLKIDEMQGGTFTITNGGIYGSLMSTPILNAPQSGILGMHRIDQRPVAIKGQVVIRPMMYLALSYDHRIVDGKEAVTFLVRVKEAIEDPQRLLLDL